MKYILLAIIAAFTFSSCSKNETKENGRMKFIEKYNKKSFLLYEIIEVDGVEYLSTSRGGICPLVKDTTNKKTVFKIND